MNLNIPVLRDMLPKFGMNDAELAKRMDVSREAVSKWLSGESMPRPDKLIRLGMLLGLSFDQLVIRPVMTLEPKVFFRQKTNRKTDAQHLEKAKTIGLLLEELAPYLPPSMLAAPTLEAPRVDDAYIQQVAIEIRKRIKKNTSDAIIYKDLVTLFEQLRVTIIPVFWGEQKNHGNALHIYLPSSKRTWVHLNVDSSVIDFNFWMAHELGHALSPTLSGNEAEDFAEAFAQALLFPRDCVVQLLEHLRRLPLAERVDLVFEKAKERNISPYTIYCALEEYSKQVPVSTATCTLGNRKTFMARLEKEKKGWGSMASSLLGNNRVTPKHYITALGAAFNTSFFTALARYLNEHPDNAAQYIHRVIDISLVDAKALEEALCK